VSSYIKFSRIHVAFVLAIGLCHSLWAAQPTPLIETDLAMSDGVTLKTFVYAPEGDGPWPVIMMRTPYPIGMLLSMAPPARYAAADYAFVLQSSRGTGDSKGEFNPFSHARNDAKDTLDWIAKQSFCNGKIGLSGASAMGITANYAASLGHANVKAAFVMVAPQSSFSEVTFMGGVFKQAQVSQWMNMQKAPQQVGKLKARPVMDDEWAEIDFPRYLDKVDIPIFNVGGWYDIFLGGTLANFTYFQNEGAPGAKGNQMMRIGAFGHMDIEGDLAYPNAGSMMASMGKDEMRWFDHWLKGVDNGIDEEAAVEYYLMASARKGAASEKNRIIEASNWPPAVDRIPFYLQPGLGLTTEPATDDGASTTYSFDPKKPVKTNGGSNLFLPRGPKDQREAGERQDYLRFQTDPLDKDVTVVGKIEVDLYAATDGLDTDFMVKLVDVYPDGYEALLLDAPIRARYRNGRNPEDVKMMTPGKPEKMTIDLWSTANVFEKGHRIAVHVTSSNAPRFEVNPNTGHEPGSQSKETRIAQNTIHHSSEFPSAIILPISSELSSDSTD